MQGKIVSINCAATQPEGKPHMPTKKRMHHAKLSRYGFVGDFHNRQMRPSFSKPGTLKPNTDRHISLVALEVIEAANRELGLSLCPGDLGENITTEGLGDLSALVEGDRLIIVHQDKGTPICELKVSEQITPCVNLSLIDAMLAKCLFGRRGVVCSIVTGVDNILCEKDAIRIVPA